MPWRTSQDDKAPHLQAQQLMDTGHDIECDHCHYVMEVVAIQPVTFCTVRPSQRRPHRAAPQLQVQQARTLSPAQAARLLGRGRR
jgi:hypothetical protein